MNSNAIMLHGLPNGFSFKYFVYTELIQVVKSYGGHSNGCHRSSYSIPRHVYVSQYKFIMLDITHAINKTRLMLNWGLDYESEVCTLPPYIFDIRRQWFFTIIMYLFLMRNSKSSILNFPLKINT